MGVEYAPGAGYGSLIFIAVGIVAAFIFSFYVKQKTKDPSMKTDNAK